MPQIIPLIPSEPHYDFATVIDGIPCIFEVRWNSRDEAWYFDVFDSERKAIASGIKIVLGVHLGRRYSHPLFDNGVFVAYDLSGSRTDARFDDIGTRVQLRHYTEFEIAATLKQQGSG